MSETQTPTPALNRSSAKAWLRALELTARIPQNPYRTFPVLIQELGQRFGDAPALLSHNETLTYRSLAERANRYSRWAVAHGLSKDQTVCLLMPNRPEYTAIWIGITAVGVTVALLNTNLTGTSLAHSIDVVQARHVIVSSELAANLDAALPHLTIEPAIWRHGDGAEGSRRIDREIEAFHGDLLPEEDRGVTIRDRALCIYTSGTTGLPKAANVSHFRLMRWSHWFAGMMDTRATDRMYNCLPMYHSVGGVVATGAVLVAGGSVVISEKFSARRFWSEIAHWDCTLFQYIGELCRYLVTADPDPEVKRPHSLRMCCGNGLRPDIWSEFKRRFAIPQILEFYASTEGHISLFNIDGRSGSIGHIPPYLAHRQPTALLKFNVERQELMRNEKGDYIAAGPNEPGEVVGRILDGPANASAQFEGYTDAKASEQKILRDVFQAGDSWFRTGDLMRKDEKGYFYFVDRIGDTFRWKGENVSTTEVAEVICSFPGVKDANVYGVAIPGAEGKAGMAALVTQDDPDLAALRSYLAGRLPGYARPVFLRFLSEMGLTATFKHTKGGLMSEGYDPAVVPDGLYYDDYDAQSYRPLDPSAYDRIRDGRMRF